MTRPSTRSRLRAVILVWLVLVPVGASAQSAGPLTPDEEASLQQIREFVQATAQYYRMLAPLEVSVASWVGNSSLPQYASSPAVYTGGRLYLNRRLLRASNRDLVIATALAYEIHRAPSQATSLAERERERARHQLEANARAVEILVQVGGLSEETALERMYVWLLAIRRAALAAGRQGPAGVATTCESIGDLLGRFPAVREKFAGRECAPA